MLDHMIVESEFLTNLFSKVVAKKLKKRFGCEFDIQINSAEAVAAPKKVKVHLDTNIEMSKEEFAKFLLGL